LPSSSTATPAQLEGELYIGGYYVRLLSDGERYSDFPVEEPERLLTDLIAYLPSSACRPSPVALVGGLSGRQEWMLAQAHTGPRSHSAPRPE